MSTTDRSSLKSKLEPFADELEESDDDLARVLAALARGDTPPADASSRVLERLEGE